MTHLGRSHLRALAATILLLVIKSTSLELSDTQEKTLIGQPSYQTTITTNTLNGLLPCNLELCRAVTCSFALIQMISNFCSLMFQSHSQMSLCTCRNTVLRKEGFWLETVRTMDTWTWGTLHDQDNHYKEVALTSTLLFNSSILKNHWFTRLLAV